MAMAMQVAARLLPMQRRISSSSSLFHHHRRHQPHSFYLFKDLSSTTTRRSFHFNPNGSSCRGLNTKAETATVNPMEIGVVDEKKQCGEIEKNGSFEDTNDGEFVVVTATRRDFSVKFTHAVCGTKSVKMINKKAFDKGLVVVLCGGCKQPVVIANHYGRFDEERDLKDFFATTVPDLIEGSLESLNFGFEDLDWLKGKGYAIQVESSTY